MSEFEVWTGLVSSEASLLALQLAASSHGLPTMHTSLLSLCVS